MIAGYRTSHATVTNDHDNDCTDTTVNAGPPTSTGGSLFKWQFTACSDCTQEGGAPETHFVKMDLDDWDTVQCSNPSATGYFEVTADIFFCPPLQSSMMGYDIGSVFIRNPSLNELDEKSLKVVSAYVGGSQGSLITWAQATWRCATGPSAVDWVPSQVEYLWGSKGTSESNAAKGHVPDEIFLTVRCCTTSD